MGCALACAALSLACPGPTPETGVDLFRVAVSGAPGGSLLAVYGDNTREEAWIVGGYVGVDPAAVPEGRVGRVVSFDGRTFTTRCTTDRVLWWIHGTRDETGLTLFAVGEGQRVLRVRDGRCETLDTGLSFTEGVATFWGVHAFSSQDVWLVGGSAQPTGPHGVLVHFDGTRFRRVTTLPPEALEQNLYKVTATRDGTMIVVGGSGVVLEGREGAMSAVQVPSRGFDNRLFTVSCGPLSCYAVGGTAQGLALSRRSGAWQPFGALGEPPGLNGVFVQDESNVFMVGIDGLTAHTNGFSAFLPPRALTPASLHGVGGFGGVVLAVGGELSERSASQRGVVLVRGNDSPSFTFDGRVFNATGNLRRAVGGSGQ